MGINRKINLVSHIKEQLSSEVIAFLKFAGDTAEKRQQRLYLVGGMVRDLLLERTNIDLDMVLEGDAIKLAEEIAAALRGLRPVLTAHPRFGTATVRWHNLSADFATARAEKYARPGALPDVHPGTIKEDLGRRDFTINAMAVELNPRHFGELIDPYGGRQDLAGEVVRVLHENSFRDDATRLWRAVRYEQRLGFCIEPMTLLLIERDIAMLKTVGGDRIRHELELVLKEEEPEKALRRAGELGVLGKLSPGLRADDWLAEKFAAARDACRAVPPHPHLYLALLCYRLAPAEAARLIAYLRLPKAAAAAVQDTLDLKAKIRELYPAGQSPSVLYELLHGYCQTAYEASLIAADAESARENIELYLSVLKYVRPALNGDDLKKMGVPRGPGIKEALQKLRKARLDGTIDSKEGEEEMVRKWDRGGR